MILAVNSETPGRVKFSSSRQVHQLTYGHNGITKGEYGGALGRSIRPGDFDAVVSHRLDNRANVSGVPGEAEELHRISFG
jgi:hypothetical protein